MPISHLQPHLIYKDMMKGSITRNLIQRNLAMVCSKRIYFATTASPKNPNPSINTEHQLNINQSNDPHACLQDLHLKAIDTHTDNIVKNKLVKVHSIERLKILIETSSLIEPNQLSSHDLDYIKALVQKTDQESVRLFKESKKTLEYFNRVFNSGLQNNDIKLLTSFYELIAIYKTGANSRPVKLIDMYKMKLLFDKLKTFIESNDSTILDCVTISKSSTVINDGLVTDCNKALSTKLKEQSDDDYTADQLLEIMRYANQVLLAYDNSLLILYVIKHWSVILDGSFPLIVDAYRCLINFRSGRQEVQKTLALTGDYIIGFSRQISFAEKLEFFKLLPDVNRIMQYQIEDLVVDTVMEALQMNAATLGPAQLSYVLELFSQYNATSKYRNLYEAAKKGFFKNKDKWSKDLTALISRDIVINCRTARTSDDIRELMSPVVVSHVKTAVSEGSKVEWPMTLYCIDNDFQAIIEFLQRNRKTLLNEDLAAIDMICQFRGFNANTEEDELRSDKPFDIKVFIDVIDIIPFTVNIEVPKALIMFKDPSLTQKHLLEAAYTLSYHTNEIIALAKNSPNILSTLDTCPNISLSTDGIILFLNEFNTQFKNKVSPGLITRFHKFLLYNPFVKNYIATNMYHASKKLEGLLETFESASVERSSFENFSLSRILVNLCLDNIFKRQSHTSPSRFVICVMEFAIGANNNRWVDLVNDLSYRLIKLPDHINTAYINYMLTDENPTQRRLSDIIDHAFVGLQTYIDRGLLPYLDVVYDQYFNNVPDKDLEFQSLRILLKILNKQDVEILDKLKHTDLNIIGRYDFAIDLLILMIHRTGLTRDTVILDLFTNILLSYKDLTKIGQQKLIRMVKLFNTNKDVLVKCNGLIELLDYHLQVNELLELPHNARSDAKFILDYMMLTNKSMEGLLTSEKIPDATRVLVIKNLILARKPHPALFTAFMANIQEVVKSMTGNMSQLLELIILNVNDLETQRMALETILMTRTERALYNTTFNNYILLWLYINHNDIYDAIVAKKASKFKHEFKPHIDTVYLHDILSHLGISHEYNVYEDNLGVAEFVCGNIIVTRDIGHNDIKLRTLAKIYPEKTIHVFKRGNIERLSTVEQIEELLLGFGVISEGLVEGQREILTELLGKREFYKKQEGEGSSRDRYDEEQENDVFEKNDIDSRIKYADTKSPQHKGNNN